MPIEFDDEDFKDEDEEDDPECSSCGCDLFTEEHEWDCPHAGEDDDDEDDDEDPS